MASPDVMKTHDHAPDPASMTFWERLCGMDWRVKLALVLMALAFLADILGRP